MSELTEPRQMSMPFKNRRLAIDFCMSEGAKWIRQLKLGSVAVYRVFESKAYGCRIDAHEGGVIVGPWKQVERKRISGCQVLAR